MLLVMSSQLAATATLLHINTFAATVLYYGKSLIDY
jgi:hypothetical protein